VNWRVPLADLDYGPEEEAAVQAVIHRRWLTMGDETRQFEEEFAAFTGARYAVAVTNCTAALHLAAVALDLGPGDEVILPSLTFVATANSMRYVGAMPIFADVCGEEDFGLDPADAAAKITPKTRAIVVMHYGGYPVDMPAILDLARRHDLAVIEDAAHAPGSQLNGRHLGTWGDIGCFSFFSNKNLATGEGGMLTTNDDMLAEKLRLLRSHGMTSLTWDRHKGHAFGYDVVAPGYNYRLDEIRSALGQIQLQKLPAGNKKRSELNRLYEEQLSILSPELG
jgi:dTDP-4-amino-4,6-dideoxygalactose transaminase